MKSYALVSHRPCPDCGDHVWEAYVLERHVQPVAGLTLVATQFFPSIAKIDWASENALARRDIVNVCATCGATIL